MFAGQAHDVGAHQVFSVHKPPKKEMPTADDPWVLHLFAPTHLRYWLGGPQGRRTM